MPVWHCILECLTSNFGSVSYKKLPGTGTNFFISSWFTPAFTSANIFYKFLELHSILSKMFVMNFPF